jgi:hypothetical protein
MVPAGMRGYVHSNEDKTSNSGDENFQPPKKQNKRSGGTPLDVTALL